MYTQQLELEGRRQNWDPDTEAAPDEIDAFESMAQPLDDHSLLGMSVTPDGQRVDRLAHVGANGTADAMEQLGVRVVRTTFGEPQ
jgi:hypothetical protein